MLAMPRASMGAGCWVMGDGCWGAADTEVAANKPTPNTKHQTPNSQHPTPLMAPFGSLKNSFEPLPKSLEAPMRQTPNI